MLISDGLLLNNNGLLSPLLLPSDGIVDGYGPQGVITAENLENKEMKNNNNNRFVCLIGMEFLNFLNFFSAYKKIPTEPNKAVNTSDTRTMML